MKLRQKCAFVLCTLIFVLPILAGSCKKKKDEPPTAVITVVDSVTNAPLAGIKVRLGLDQKSQVTGLAAVPPDPDTQTTDALGEVTFVIKHEATYIAYVSHRSTIDTATAIVRFRKNEINRVTIPF